MYSVREGGLFRWDNGAAQGAVVRKVAQSSLIAIGEFVAWKQPEAWRLLVRQYLCELVDWDRLMRESPKPGRAGVFPEEAETVG